MSKRGVIDHPTERRTRFDPLFESHYDAIYRYCVRRLGRSDAEDAAADVFAVAWRRLDEMPEGDIGKAWLFGVAHRVVGNQHRSRRRQTRLSARLEAMSTIGGAGPEIEAPANRGVEMLLMALDKLSPTDQELLRLSTWDGLTRSEIAHVLGIKENAVDQRLHRARSRLKARLDHLNRQSSSSDPEEASA